MIFSSQKEVLRGFFCSRLANLTVQMQNFVQNQPLFDEVTSLGQIRNAHWLCFNMMHTFERTDTGVNNILADVHSSLLHVWHPATQNLGQIGEIVTNVMNITPWEESHNAYCS